MAIHDYTKMMATLKKILLHRIEQGTLVLPTLPKVASDLQQLLDDPKTDQSKIIKLIDKDPTLIAHVMKVSNSSMNRRSGKQESMSKAVSQIGFRSLKNILLTAISRQIFVSHDPRINATITAIYEHSLAVGLLARNVAGISGCRDVEPAFVAGLLHDIGKIVVAAYLLEFERGLPTREAMDWIDLDSWLHIVEELQRDIGKAIIAGWNLPTIIIRIIDEFEDYDASDRISPLNSVLFANALAKREGLYEGLTDHDGVQSMIMIGKSLLGIDDAVISGLTREINDQILV
ncbi:MAG: HDOD domain-containing protein [Myxococcota bacterium]|nr:HDOD domain-containing protein [Myxococcota bacterium]